MFSGLTTVPGRRNSAGTYLAALTLVCGLTALGLGQLVDQVVSAGDTLLPARHGIAVSPPPTLGRGKVTLTQDEWTERLRSHAYWSGRSASPSGPSMPFVSRASYDGPAAGLNREAASRYHDGDDTTYSTVCVRLCDGYYWPISFSTTEDNFGRDRVTCERSCGQPARLFVYRNPGGEPADMRDLDRQPYSRLKTAFLYRSTYDAQCKCKADPWEQEAKDRHRLYALESASRKGDKLAAKEAEGLRRQMHETHRAKLRAQVELHRTTQPAAKTANASASIVAASAQTIVQEGRTLEVVDPASVAAAPKPAPVKQRQTASGSERSPPMRLGAGSSNGSSSGGYTTQSGSSGGSADWRRAAFRSN